MQPVVALENLDTTALKRYTGEVYRGRSPTPGGYLPLNGTNPHPRVILSVPWLDTRESIKPRRELRPRLIRLVTISKEESKRRGSTEISDNARSYGTSHKDFLNLPSPLEKWFTVMKRGKKKKEMNSAKGRTMGSGKPTSDREGRP